jgi:hypothetical protein
METIDHVLGGISFFLIVVTNFGFAKQKRWAFIGALTANLFWAVQSYRIGNWTYFFGIVLVLFPLSIIGWFQYKSPQEDK